MKQLLTIFLFIPFLAFNQDIKSNVSQINFGNVFEGTTDSIQITLINTTIAPVTITGFKFYSIYNDNPFFTKQSAFTIPAQSNGNLWVYFSPVHNILHNSEMIVQHNANSGFVAIDLIGQGKFSNTYYNSTENLSEQALKNALKVRLAQGYNQRSYNQARDQMYSTIDNSGGQVECVYTGRRASFTTRSGANSNNFNCEHTFPQGFFNSSLPERSDIHHLFPTDVNSNSQRGNLPFGVVTGSGTWSQGGSKKGNGRFEPRTIQKGATARAMMYFVIRYQDYSSHFLSQETILRQWHNTYPPSTQEESRNNAIYATQNNRNPFVDYPQFEERITNFVSNSVAPQVFGLDVLQSSINFGNVPVLAADTFDYTLVNRGSRNIQFSNFSLSNGSILSFEGSTGNNASLAPGEDLKVSIILQPSAAGNITETLSFATNIPGGQSSFSIPIRARSVTVGINASSLSEELEVYPNPFSDQLFIKYSGNENLSYRILNATGQEMLKPVSSDPSRLELGDLPKGIYFLEISNGRQNSVKRLIK